MLSARSNPRAVAVLGQVVGGLISGAAALTIGVTMSSAAWSWSAVAACGDALGVVFLYRGLSRGRMSVVAPLSGLGAAALPAVVGILDGERPGLGAAFGLVVAVPAILLVAHVREVGARPSGWPDGLVAGLGFGLNFLAIARLPHEAGLAGIALMQLGAAALIALTVISGGPRTLRVPRAYVLGAAATGVLAGLALLLFQIASHHGYLSETAVLSSLYPAATVTLALVLLREAVTSVQVAGFALCALSIGLIVSG